MGNHEGMSWRLVGGLYEEERMSNLTCDLEVQSTDFEVYNLQG